MTLNKLYGILALVLLLVGSHWWAYHKGGVNRENAIVAEQKAQADKQLMSDLERVSEDLKLALQRQDESEKRAMSLSATLSANQKEIHELQKDLQDANKEIDPACSKLTPARYRLYQSLYNKTPSTISNRNH